MILDVINANKDLFIIIGVIMVLLLSLFVLQLMWLLVKLLKRKKYVKPKDERSEISKFLSFHSECFYCPYSHMYNNTCRFQYIKDCFDGVNNKTLEEVMEKCNKCACKVCVNNKNR